MQDKIYTSSTGQLYLIKFEVNEDETNFTIYPLKWIDGESNLYFFSNHVYDVERAYILFSGRRDNLRDCNYHYYSYNLPNKYDLEDLKEVVEIAKYVEMI